MNDLIDRQAALDIFKPWLDVKGYSEGELNMLRAVIYELETMPGTSAWVSVKDRLPENDEEVLVWYEYFRYGEYNCLYQTWGIGEYFKNYNSWMIDHSTAGHKLRVIAWMPLPKPPKENEE